MTRLFLRLVGGATVVGALAAPASAGAACAGADASAGSVPPAVTRAAIRCLTNAARAVHGLPALRSSARLDHVAQAHTDAMVSARVFEHDLSPSAGLGNRVRTAGYEWRIVAENIAAGYETPRRVVAVWLRSESHCRTILAPTFSHIGVGVTRETPFATDGGTFTLDVALMRGARAPSSERRAQRRCPHELDTDGDGVSDFVPGTFGPQDLCPDVAVRACPDRALVYWVRRLGHRRLAIAGVVVGAHPAPVVGIRVMRRRGHRVWVVPLSSTGRFVTVVRIPRGAGMTRLRLRAHAGGHKLIERLTLR